MPHPYAEGMTFSMQGGGPGRWLTQLFSPQGGPGGARRNGQAIMRISVGRQGGTMVGAPK
jgi:hypothetical protein